MVWRHFSLSCARSSLVLADVASALPLDAMMPSSALPVHCACAGEAANKAQTMITTVDRRRTENLVDQKGVVEVYRYAPCCQLPAKQLGEMSDKIITAQRHHPPRPSAQVIAHLAIHLAHIFQPDELIDQQRHDLVGQLAAMLLEIVGDGLRQLLAGAGLAAERMQMLDDGREVLGMRAPRARNV